MMVRAIPSWFYGLVAMAALIFMLAWHERGVGAAKVQARWDASTAAIAKAALLAVAKREAENASIADTQAATVAEITRVHDEEIAKLRTAVRNAPRMRLPAFCASGSGPAAPAGAASSPSSNAADTGAGFLPTGTETDIRALVLAAEEAAATGRACQAFVRGNGMS